MTNHPTTSQHQIIIIGGGTAGTTVAASLLRQRPDLDVAVIEPSELHYYQPAFTLVGGGAYQMKDTYREQKTTLPQRATWIKAAVLEIDPRVNLVTLNDSRQLGYQYLVVAAGIKLDWDCVQGLRETLGRNGVCSNYSADTAPYTWECLRQFGGGNAVFTQSPAPIKCAGAPQKIAYLAAHYLRKQGLSVKSKVLFYNAGAALFSVPAFVPHLQKVMDRYGIDVKSGFNLVAVDGARKIAVFEQMGGEKLKVEQPFDMLHVTPHQCAPDFLRQSLLANADGWVEVDRHSTQHLRYPNVFSLGDASSLPTSKTAAAVRKQAPVTVKNLLAALDQKPLTARYDGYTSCPLVTAYGKVILAEFIYDGVITPTLPLDPFKESSFYWGVKKYLLPAFYWRQMLRGKEPDIAHTPLPKKP